MKNKFTKLEKQWILYDVGNSAFIMLTSTIIPIYFNHLAQNAGISSVDYLAYWGYTASIVTIIVALLGPILGTVSDTRGFKKPIFFLSILVGCVGCVMLGFISKWLLFLGIFIIAKIGFNTSLIFYDSMLGDVTTEERMDKVSSSGYAWGYIGSCIPFVISIAIVLGYETIGLSFQLAMIIVFIINAVWWMVMSLPLLKGYKQKYFVEKQNHIISDSFGRIFSTLKNLKNEKIILLFLLAYFFYIDGVYTIIDMATAYGSAMGLDNTGLLLALLLTQIVAFPCAIIFGRLASKYSGDKLILVCILAYCGIAVFAIFLRFQWQFWLMAVLVGMFQGGIQALSRSYFTKIIPKEQSGEYFGLMDICGKGASFIGTAMVGLVSQITGSVNAGVGTLAVMFILGFIFFIASMKAK